MWPAYLVSLTKFRYAALVDDSSIQRPLHIFLVHYRRPMFRPNTFKIFRLWYASARCKIVTFIMSVWTGGMRGAFVIIVSHSFKKREDSSCIRGRMVETRMDSFPTYVKLVIFSTRQQSTNIVWRWVIALSRLIPMAWYFFESGRFSLCSTMASKLRLKNQDSSEPSRTRFPLLFFCSVV